MLRNVLWGIVAVIIVAVTVLSEYRRRKKHNERPHRAQIVNESEMGSESQSGIEGEITSETARQTAIEREKTRRYPPGGNGLY